MRYIVAMPGKSPIRSIGIIMDGNRRWAKARGLPSFEGHRQGYEALKKLADEFPRLKETYGLEYATLYAFSTENWKRSADEVEFLMQIFASALTEMIDSVTKGLAEEKKIRIRIAGQRERFSPQLRKLMDTVEEKTKDFTAGTVCFALSYGGRAEIVNAANEIIKNGDEMSEENVNKYLWTAGIPDPDLVIRTSGEERVSGFLTWQSVYSELFFTDTLWPDFTVIELEKIFAEFHERERRHGT